MINSIEELRKLFPGERVFLQVTSHPGKEALEYTAAVGEGMSFDSVTSDSLPGVFGAMADRMAKRAQYQSDRIAYLRGEIAKIEATLNRSAK